MYVSDLFLKIFPRLLHSFKIKTVCTKEVPDKESYRFSNIYNSNDDPGSP